MIELHLIGYTEDLESLVFDRDPEGEGTHCVAVDPDLLATIDQLVGQRPTPPVDGGRGEDRRSTTDSGAGPDPVDHTEPDEDLVAEPGEASAETPPRPPTERTSTHADGPPPAALRAPQVATRAQLSPAEIQAQLRAGRTVRAVAREAGTDVAWVERWLAPILAERDRVLGEAWAASFGSGRTKRPLGKAVDRNLVEMGVEPDSARWEAARRSDGRWKVSVRFSVDRRPRTATWIFDRDDVTLKAQSPLATELAGPRQRTPRAKGGRASGRP